MAEEHRCQAPRLCVNNCGFFGSPATENLCSKCYRDLQLKEQQSTSAKQALTETLTSSASSSSPSSLLSVSSPALDLSEFVKKPHPAVNEQNPEQPTIVVTKTQQQQSPQQQEEEEEQKQPPPPNRCWTCRKKVGLTGFKCRCGSVLCGTHRYPEQHECSFDFKTMGKEQIAKANPVIKGAKLEKI